LENQSDAETQHIESINHFSGKPYNLKRLNRARIKTNTKLHIPHGSLDHLVYYVSREKRGYSGHSFLFFFPFFLVLSTAMQAGFLYSCFSQKAVEDAWFLTRSSCTLFLDEPERWAYFEDNIKKERGRGEHERGVEKDLVSPYLDHAPALLPKA